MIQMRNKTTINLKGKLKLIEGRPDLTPIVDILFLLLIFFMLSSSFVQVSGVDVDLPELSSRSTKGVKKFVITVDRFSKLWFNDQLQTIPSLKEELLRVSSDTIVIRADKNAPFGEVAKIMALAEEANLNAFIAINSTDESSGPVMKESAENE